MSNGDPGGRALIYNHGLLSLRFEAVFADGVARRLGLRLIAVDRPGCGGSDPLPGRKLLDWPWDVGVLAATLRLPHFHVFGVSGGGPYALACANELAGTLLFEFAAKHPCVARRTCSADALAAVSADCVRRTHDGCASSADRSALREPAIRAGFAKALREGARQGVGGALTDVGLYGRDWGFRPEDVAASAQLWQGENDHTVPPNMVRHLADRLAYCTARFLPGEGHFSLPVQHAGNIWATLAATEGV
jgi:pimeloyl-ACP methyl ester carboxylesterase